MATQRTTGRFAVTAPKPVDWTRTHTAHHGLSRTDVSVPVRGGPCPSVPTSGSGFTLMELLVAMVLMVVVGSCLYTALYTGFRARRSAQLAVDPTAQAINAIELLKQDILGVLPPGSGLAASFIGTDSRGIKGVETDALELYTTHIYADDENLSGGLAKIGLLLEEDTDDDRPDYGYRCYRLVREVTTNLLSSKEVDPEEQVLCRDVTSLNLRYYDGDSWLDDWDSTEDANSLPKAVEIEIELAYFGRSAREVRNSRQEPEKRRLIQCFPIPVETAEATSQETTTGGTTSGGGAG